MGFWAAVDWAKTKFPKEYRLMMRLWKESWQTSRTISILALSVPIVIFLVVGFFAGKMFNTTNIYLPKTDVATASGLPPGPQLARLLIHFLANNPNPDVIEAENVVLPPISFQWDEGGNEITEPSTRHIKWSYLVLIFDRPVTGKNLRILFEGAETPIDRQSLTDRSARIFFRGSLDNKTLQIEVRP